MQALRMLGGIGLSATDGRDVDALLRQPKHLALLAYLAMPRPGTWHRRDLLLAIFWPDLDQARARTALRSALHTLRKHLLDGTVRTRGQDEVSVDPEIINTDVAAMLDNIAAGRYAEALAQYHGDLLPGLYVTDAEGFEKWLGTEREKLSALASRAAWSLGAKCEKDGDLKGAVDAARLGSDLNPSDESAVRRWIELLYRAGDGAQSLAVYDRFQKRLANDFGAQPSAETAALAERLRAPQTGRPRPDERGLAQGPAVSARRDIKKRSPAFNDQSRETSHARPLNRRRLGLIAAGLMTVAAGVGMVNRAADDASAGNPPRLVILPMSNETGDTAKAYLAAGAGEGIARRLERFPGLSVRSGARSPWLARFNRDFKAVEKELGSTVLLKTTLRAIGDSLEIRAALVDAEQSTETAITARQFTMTDLRNVESEVAAAVAGALFRVPLPAVPRSSNRVIDPESYRLMLEGWHQLLTLRDEEEAKKLFQRATTVDPMNSRAWAGLSSAWAVQTTSERAPFEEGYERSTAAAERALSLDSLEGTAWANLAILRALRQRSLAAGKPLIEKAIAAEPGNPEIFVIASTLYRNAWRWDDARDAIRVARRLDPLNPYNLDREAAGELCAANPDAALKLYQDEAVLNPSNAVALLGRTRALVRLERYDQAIDSWRFLAAVQGDSQLVARLRQARGKEGYLNLKRREGQRKLAKLRNGAAGSWISPLQLMQLQFEAGETEAGFASLDRLVHQKHQSLYRLPCLPGVDVVRSSERFKAIVQTVGAMPLR